MILGRCSTSRDPGPRTQGDVPNLVSLVWACQHHLTLQLVSADPFPVLSVIQLQMVALAWASVTKCPRLGGVHWSFLNSGSQPHIWHGPHLSWWGVTVASCWSPTMYVYFHSVCPHASWHQRTLPQTPWIRLCSEFQVSFLSLFFFSWKRKAALIRA